MKIAEIRSVIDSCNWCRDDLGGATPDEFKKMDVPARLLPHIERVRALVIPERFAMDQETASRAILRAEQTVKRWRALQGGGPQKAGPPFRLVGGARKQVYLDAETIAAAIALGNGGLSEGIRLAVKLASRGGETSGRAGAEQVVAGV